MLLLAASARLYNALLVLYPKAFRSRYSEEMRRDFWELMGEGLQEGGAKELVRVWAEAFSDLVLTALKERSTLLAARDAQKSVDPRMAARAAARAMVVVVLVAVGVSMASLLQTPTYEASAQLWVHQKQGDQQTNVAGSKAFKTLETRGGRPVMTVIHATHSRPVAKEAIERLELEMTPAELLDNLTIEQVESTSFIVLYYQGNDPEEAAQIVNTVGKVSSELIADTSALTATVYEEAIAPDSPVSPDPLRNGLLTLVMGLVLCVGLVVALPGLAASVAGKLGRPAVLQGVGQAGVPAGPGTGPSVAEVLKEKELLLALFRRRKLTAAGAALETSLSVGEAEGMLEALAAKGHLKVTVEHGRLLYSLWEHDAPPIGILGL